MAKKKAGAKKRRAPKLKTKRKPAKKAKRKVAEKKKPKNLATRAKAALKKNPKSQKKRNVRLTPKQILFVDCFLGAAKRTATKAAIMAGYSEKTASTQGSQLMKNPYVAAYLKKRQGDIARRLEVTQEKIAREMASVAFAKPTDIMQWRNGTLTLTDSDKIPDDLVGAISSVELVPTKYGKVMKVKFHDRIAAGKLLAQHLGMLDVQARDESKGVIVEAMEALHAQAAKLGKGKE